MQRGEIQILSGTTGCVTNTGEHQIDTADPEWCRMCGRFVGTEDDNETARD